MVRVKICGLSTPHTLDAALDAGADMVGFVFFAPSPRNVSLDVARELGALVRARAQKVALTVDPDDRLIEAIMAALSPDALQLHGSETPERVAEIRERTGLPVWKAIGIAKPGDVARADAYRGIADLVLFDAKPPRDATMPGGNGQAFDWTILKDATLETPWMLSGGLDAGNIAQALQVTHAPAVDVSSGVESAPGVKDPRAIRDFVAAVRRLSPAGATA